MGGQIMAFGQGVAFAAIAFAWLWIAKLVADARIKSRFDPNIEIEERKNLAVALRRGGLYVGLAVGMLGALSGGGGGFAYDALELAIEGAALTVFLFLALYITDAVVVHGISNDEAVADGNVAVGLVEAGIYVATGLIAYGSFGGEGGPAGLGAWGGIVSALAFFVLGQIALLVLAVVYERVTPYNVIEGIRSGNTAAGLMLSGMLVAFGFILNSSLMGPFTDWTTDILGFGLSATMGIALLLLLQWPIDRLFLPGTTLRQEIEGEHNAAAIAVTVSVKIALALVISAVLI